jgi:type II secretory pathway component PulF
MKQREQNLVPKTAHATRPVWQEKILNIGLGEERDYFIENLSLLLSSGLDVRQALDAISRGVRTHRMQTLLGRVKQRIDEGFGLSYALAETNLVQPHIIALIKSGELSGRLPQNLEVVGTQYKRDRSLHSKIRSAMAYPVLVLVLALTIGTGLAWFVLPKLAQVFSSLHIHLPPLTRMLISVGSLLQKHGFLFIFCVNAFTALGVYILFINQHTKRSGQALLLSIPGIKNLIKEIELARFGYLLGTLLETGFPITEALLALEPSTALFRYRALYRHLYTTILDGIPLFEGLISFPRSGKLIPLPVQHLIAAGEQSGKLPETLKIIGQTFEAKTDISAKNLTVILEPVLLVIVWLVVMFIALAVILPIYNLIGNLGGSTH